jgi:RND family efflux transporter MFP subunit
MSADTQIPRLRLRGVSFLLAALIGLGGPVLAQTLVAAPAKGAAITSVISLPAEIRAYQEAVLTAKVAGYLKALPVDKGDKVRAGDLIADIEVPELVADRAQYAAQLNVARLNYDRMQQAVKTAPDLVTPQNVDDARGKLEVAQAQLDRINTLLRYARITAPFSGTITARYVDPGAFIPVPSGNDQKSAAIVSLMDFSRIRVQIPVPEDDALKIVKGTPATFTVQGLPTRTFRASVTRVSYALDQNSKTMLAEIEMDNPGGVLRPGMYATVLLSPGSGNIDTQSR